MTCLVIINQDSTKYNSLTNQDVVNRCKYSSRENEGASQFEKERYINIEVVRSMNKCWLPNRVFQEMVGCFFFYFLWVVWFDLKIVNKVLDINMQDVTNIGLKKRQEQVMVVLLRIVVSRKVFIVKKVIIRLYEIKQMQVNQGLVLINNLQSENGNTENRYFGLNDSRVTSLGIKMMMIAPNDIGGQKTLGSIQVTLCVSCVFVVFFYGWKGCI